jgi:hypothetical protein
MLLLNDARCCKRILVTQILVDKQHVQTKYMISLTKLYSRWITGIGEEVIPSREAKRKGLTVFNAFFCCWQKSC